MSLNSNFNARIKITCLLSINSLTCNRNSVVHLLTTTKKSLGILIYGSIDLKKNPKRTKKKKKGKMIKAYLKKKAKNP